MIRTILIFLATFSFFTQIYGQEEEIYRSEGRTENPGIATYNVGVLVLSDDGSYKLTSQQYSTKKMMKNNIILGINTEYGKWDKRNGKLFLNGDTKNKDMTFILQSDTKISVLIDESGAIGKSWKRVR